VGLPKSEGYTKIWVIVDRFSKMAHFIPLKTEEHIKELALIFLKEIWRLHGLPETIISDRDTRFTSKFWMSLMRLFQVKLNVSTTVTEALCRKTDPKIATAPKTQSRSKDQNKDNSKENQVVKLNIVKPESFTQ